MNKKQTGVIALMCAVAAALALLMLRQPSLPAASIAAPMAQDHASHRDTHGHDDRHPEDAAASAGPEEAGTVPMTPAQVKANAIAIDLAGPAPIQARLHLPAEIHANAERTVALAAPAQGIVESLSVSIGTQVRKGQALAVIRSPAVAQWRADLATARQRLALARSTHERERTLWEARISARQDLDLAAAALQEAQIAVEAAGQRLQALGIAGTDGISSAVTVRAPLAGVVLDKPAVAGQALDEAKLLLVIADLSQLWVEAALPADRLDQAAIGMPARVSVGAPAQQLAGTVAFIGPVLGEATRMATVRIVLANPGGRLRPGMLASVDLMGDAAQVAVTVAQDAVQSIHQRKVVFVRTASGFRAQDVTLGRTDGKRVEVVAGLAAGMPYAAGGSFLLKADLGKRDAEHDD